MSKIAFLFPGQGSQYVGMGKELYENIEVAKIEYDKIFEKLDIDLKQVMFEGPEEKLKETKYTQPAIVLDSLILAKLLELKGIKPDFVAGHSLGEYSALAISETLGFEETVMLAAKRGEIMTEVAAKVDGTMAAIIGIEADKISEICQNVEGVVEAVNYNEPMQTVIAGEQEAIKKACDLLLEAGAKRAIILPVSGPFHSSLMKEAGEKLKEEFNKFSFNNPKIGFIANTDAKNINTKEQILDELYKQTFGPVKWVKTIQYLKEMGVTEFYEIGPGKVLRGLARKIDKSIKVKSVNSLKDLEKIVK